MDARQTRAESDAVSNAEISRLTEKQYDAWLQLAGRLMVEDDETPERADRLAYERVTTDAE